MCPAWDCLLRTAWSGRLWWTSSVSTHVALLFPHSWFSSSSLTHYRASVPKGEAEDGKSVRNRTPFSCLHSFMLFCWLSLVERKILVIPLLGSFHVSQRSCSWGSPIWYCLNLHGCCFGTPSAHHYWLQTSSLEVPYPSEPTFWTEFPSSWHMSGYSQCLHFFLSLNI